MHDQESSRRLPLAAIPYADLLFCTLDVSDCKFPVAWLVLLGKIGWDTYTCRSAHRVLYRMKEYAPSQRTLSDSGKDDTRLQDSATDGMPLMHSAEMGSFDARYGPEETRKRGWWNVSAQRYEEESDVTDNRFASPPRTIPTPQNFQSTTVHLGPAIPISSPPLLSPMTSPQPRMPSHSFSRTPVSPPPAPAAPVGISRTMILAASGNTDHPCTFSCSGLRALADVSVQIPGVGKRWGMERECNSSHRYCSIPLIFANDLVL